LFFADKFAKLQSDLEAVYNQYTNLKDIANKQMELVGKFYEGIEKDMDNAQAFMENCKNRRRNMALTSGRMEVRNRDKRARLPQ
jgi:hypothetical protein